MAQVDIPKDSKQVVVNLTMTVEEARKVIWQDLYHPRAPIGNLLDTKQIQYGNLCWAVEGAPTPEMRAAALTLVAHWIGEPATLNATRRFGPKVIEASHYLEDQELDGLVNFVMYMMAGLFFVFIAAWNIIQQIVSNKSGPIPLSVIVAVNLLLLTVISFWLFRRTRRELSRWKSSKQGRKGEDKIVESFRTILDSHWTIIRNLQLPDGRKGDIDIILVGPDGVWVIEVKAFKANARIYNRKMEMQIKGKWRQTDSDPIKQVTDNARRLNNLLEKQGIQRFVERAIAISELQSPSEFVSSEIPVWVPATIESQVANLSTRYPPSSDEINLIVDYLTQLAEQQLAVEDAKSK